MKPIHQEKYLVLTWFGLAHVMISFPTCNRDVALIHWFSLERHSQQLLRGTQSILCTHFLKEEDPLRKSGKVLISLLSRLAHGIVI